MNCSFCSFSGDLYHYAHTSTWSQSADIMNFQDIFKQTQLTRNLIPCVPYKSQVLSLLLFLLPFLKDDKRITSMKITRDCVFQKHQPKGKSQSYTLTFLLLQIICIFFHPQLCFYLSFSFIKYILKEKTNLSTFRNQIENHRAKLN